MLLHDIIREQSTMVIDQFLRDYLLMPVCRQWLVEQSGGMKAFGENWAKTVDEWREELQ